MKVILKKDIPKIGKRGEIKEMNDGYARNFLIPHSLAEIATPEAVANLEKIKKIARIEKEIEHDLLLRNLKQLAGVTVVLKRPANEQGHLFSGIHPNDIVESLRREHRIEILPEHLVIPKPIKETGTFTVEVEVKDIKASFVVEVMNDKK
jgi:large subunit ribosomal protein L9